MYLENIWSDSNPDLFKESIGNYLAYLNSNREVVPDSVFEFANADWHYNVMDHRCPHDAWLESIEIQEASSDDDDKLRRTSIHIALLGAHHNGRLCLSYSGVTNYNLSRDVSSDDPFLKSIFMNGHGDLLVDEFALSDDGAFIHVITFSNGVTWKIHFQDFAFKWTPF